MYFISAYRDPPNRPARRALAAAIAPRLARLPPPLPAPTNRPAARIHTISTRTGGDQVRHLDRPEDERRREEQDRRKKEERDILGDIWDTVVDTADTVSDAAGDAWDATSDFAEDAWDATSEFAEDAWDATSDIAEDAWDTTRKVVGGGGQALLNTGKSLYEIGRDAWHDRDKTIRAAKLLRHHPGKVWNHYFGGTGERLAEGAGELLDAGADWVGDKLEGAGEGLELIFSDFDEAKRRARIRAKQAWQGAGNLYGDVREGVRDVGQWLEAVEEDPGKLLRDAPEAFRDFKHWSTVATQEASLGTSDEIFAFLRALAGDKGTFQERYKHELGVQRDFLKRYEDARPNAAASAKFVGGALTTLKLFGKAGLIGHRSKNPLVRGLLAPGERLVTQIPKGGVGFASLGALHGFMTGKGGLEERIKKMMDDAAWFGLLGAVQPFGAGPLDAFRRRIGDKLSAFLTKEGNHRIAARQFAATIKKQFGNLSEEELIELMKQRLGGVGTAMRIGPKLEKEFQELARRRAGKRNSAAEAWRLATGSRRPAGSLPAGARREYQRLLRSRDPEVLEQALRQGLKSHALEGDWLPWWFQSLGWKGMGDSLDPWFGVDVGKDGKVGGEGEDEQSRREPRALPRQIPQRRQPPPQSG